MQFYHRYAEIISSFFQVIKPDPPRILSYSIRTFHRSDMVIALFCCRDGYIQVVHEDKVGVTYYHITAKGFVFARSESILLPDDEIELQADAFLPA